MKKKLMIFTTAFCVGVLSLTINSNNAFSGECQNTVVQNSKNKFFSMSGCKADDGSTCVIRCKQPISIGGGLVP